MARTFTRASSHKISLGTAVGPTLGPGTMAFIARKATDPAAYGVPLSLGTADATAWFIHSAGSADLQVWNGTVDVVAPFGWAASDGWCLIAVTKATGTVAPRFHKYVFSTNTWTHQNAASTMANRIPSGHATLGAEETAAATFSGFFDGDIEIAAVWPVVLADDEIEALAFTLIDWYKQNPGLLVMLDQGAVAQKVVDLSGHTFNESGITGTAVATSSVPVFNRSDGVIVPSIKSAAGGTQSVIPTSIATSGSISAGPTITSTVSVVPTGIPTSESVGTRHRPGATLRPSLKLRPSTSDLYIPNPIATFTPTSIPSGESISAGPTVVPGAVSVVPTSIPTAGSISTGPTVTTTVSVVPTSIPTGESISAGPTVSLSAGGTQNVIPTSIATGESIGAGPTVVPGSVSVIPTSIPTGQSISAGPTVSPGPVSVVPTSIPTGQSISAGPVVTSTRSVVPTSIPSGEHFHQNGRLVPSLSRRPSTTLHPATDGLSVTRASIPSLVVVPTSIPSGESIGGLMRVFRRMVARTPVLGSIGKPHLGLYPAPGQTPGSTGSDVEDVPLYGSVIRHPSSSIHPSTSLHPTAGSPGIESWLADLTLVGRGQLALSITGRIRTAVLQMQGHGFHSYTGVRSSDDEGTIPTDVYLSISDTAVRLGGSIEDTVLTSMDVSTDLAHPLRDAELSETFATVEIL